MLLWWVFFWGGERLILMGVFWGKLFCFCGVDENKILLVGIQI
jgi:hypothetical protein